MELRWTPLTKCVIYSKKFHLNQLNKRLNALPFPIIPLIPIHNDQELATLIKVLIIIIAT